MKLNKEPSKRVLKRILKKLNEIEYPKYRMNRYWITLEYLEPVEENRANKEFKGFCTALRVKLGEDVGGLYVNEYTDCKECEANKTLHFHMILCDWATELLGPPKPRKKLAVAKRTRIGKIVCDLWKNVVVEHLNQEWNSKKAVVIKFPELDEMDMGIAKKLAEYVAKPEQKARPLGLKGSFKPWDYINEKYLRYREEGVDPDQRLVDYAPPLVYLLPPLESNSPSQGVQEIVY